MQAPFDLAKFRAHRGRGQARSDFLANLPAIVEALTAGEKLAAVWRRLATSGQFHASYTQFVSYAKQHLEKRIVVKDGYYSRKNARGQG